MTPSLAGNRPAMRITTAMSKPATSCRDAFTPWWRGGALLMALALLATAGCSRQPRRVQYYGPPGDEQPRRIVARSTNQVQTVIGEGTQARLVLAASEDWAEGQRIRLWRNGAAIGTAIIMEVTAKNAVARVLSQTDLEHPIAPGDLVVPIEVVRESTEVPAARVTSTTTESDGDPVKAIGERAYFELAAKVLRLPSDQAPELRRLQEDLRKHLAPALLPEAKP